MRIYMCVFLLLSLSSCKEELNKNPLSEAEKLLERGIASSGGWENWQNLDTIQFYKTSKLYLEDGTLEDSTYQLHTYFMYPEMNGTYSWYSDGNTNEVKYQNGTIKKLINGNNVELSDEEREQLRLAFLGAQFVMCMPFKLSDPGVKLSLDGTSEINNREVNVLKASYNSTNENHTKTHDWWFYFDKENEALQGYKVYHEPTYARVSNDKTTSVKGITFPTYRKSYRTDENDNEIFLRAEFWYEFL